VTPPSSYPRLIRVAMMYNDKVGYGPTVSTALDGIFGRAPARPPPVRHRPTRRPPAGRPADQPTGGQPPANAPEVPTPIAAVPPPGGVTALSPAKSAALQELQTALGAVKDAQRSGTSRSTVRRCSASTTR
jgi:uncharacterized membrane protein (UPF0182 family)